MPTDLDIEALIEQENSFVRATSIAHTLPIHKIVANCRELEREGIPFIIEGITLDTGSETPFGGSNKWMNKLLSTSGPSIETDTIGPGIMPVSVLPCPVEWSGWLGTSFRVPTCLLPHKGTDEFPESIDTASCISGTSGCETYFEEGAQGTTDHYLLCVCNQKTSIVWFMTSSDDAKNVSDHLASDGSPPPRAFTLSELAEAPFKVYVYVQKQGDLVVLPPRSFRQQRFQGAGVGASMFWSRMTLRGLEFAVFYDFYRRQRMCIPARYPVKSLAYEAMRSCFEQFKAAGETVSLSSTLEMRRLLGIVNEIISVESYSEEVGDQFPPFEGQPTVDLDCASCGGEIFQTAFSCEGTCLRDGKTEDSDGDKVIICPLCFVDGRTCACGKMQPLRARETGPLIEARDMVHDFFRGLAEKYLLSQDESSLASSHSIFMAAFILYQRRSQIEESNKTCTFRPGQKSSSHQAPSSSLLRCSRCHSARCFRHILAFAHIHSSTALMVHAMDDDQSVWHRYHLDHRNDYAENYSDLMLSMSTYGPHNLHHRLVYFALNFKPPHFTNQNLIAGFYDTTEQDIVKLSISAKPQSKRSTKPSGSSTSSVQNVEGTGLSKGKGRALRSRTSSTSSVVPPQPLKPGKRPFVADESSALKGVRTVKRRRTKARKVVVTSDDPEQELSALDEASYLASGSDNIPTVQTTQLTQGFSPAKPLKSFDPAVDMGIKADSSSEAPRRYRSAWSNLILPSGASSSENIWGAAKVSSDLNVIDTAAAPTPGRLLEGQSNPAGFPERDGRVPSQKPIISRPHLSSDFSFKAPPPQRDERNESINYPKQRPSSRTVSADSRWFYHDQTSPLQTPVPDPLSRSRPPTYRDRAVHSVSQSNFSGQSNRGKGSSTSFLCGDRDFTTAHPRLAEHEGSSPTLRVAASRPPRQHPERSQGTSGYLPRANIEINDPFASETMPASRRTPYPPQGVGSTRPLSDSRRRDPPPQSESPLSAENLLYYLREMDRTVEDMEAEYGHRAH